MTQRILAYVTSIAILAAGLLLPLTAAAATPQYSAFMDSNSSNTVRIVISNADAFGMINFYARQNSGSWTTITNVGRTDQSGYFSGSLNPGFFFGNGVIDTYVSVNGQLSQTIAVSGTNNCQYYNSYSNMCNLNSLTFSNSNPVLNVGQSMTVYVNNYFNFNNSVFISSNSNFNAVSAYTSGPAISISGVNSGSANIVVCANGQTYQCGTLYVTVNQYNNFGYITPSTLPSAYSNQYYSQQLQVYGANTSYYFFITSGSLPPGLTLSSNGMISGTTFGGGTYNFTVQASDYYNSNRSVTQYYTLAVNSGGSVLGTTTYPNGTLLADGGTIYIVYKNSKLGFTNFSAFEGFGFKLNNVTYGSSANLTPSSYLLTNAAGFHPWGTWIKSGNTVYFMHENGLIPVGSYDVFLNNRGQDRLVVPVNGYDFQRPILSLMEYNDSRLR